MDKVMSDGLGGAGHGGIEGFSKLDHLRMGDGMFRKEVEEEELGEEGYVYTRVIPFGPTAYVISE